MKPKCRARRTNGEPCGNYPVQGAEVCRKHGGGAPQVRARAAERRAEAAVAVAVSDLGAAAPVTDPLAALAALAGEIVAWKDQARRRVERLNDEIRYTADGQGTEQLRAEVLVFERALDRCDRVLGRIASLDIDNRLARISEAQAQVVMLAITAALDHAGITGTPAAEARAVAARQLRAAS